MADDALWHAAGAIRSDYDAVDWAATPLGPPSTWSATLRGALSLVLETRFPATLMWGSTFVLVYNEAYVELIGDKHPAALGAPSEQVFPEAWNQIGPWMAAAFEGGEPTSLEDALVPLERHGFLEECHFTFSYSAVRGEDGQVEGVIDIAAETTRQVLDRRRLGLLTRLGQAFGTAEREVDVVERALPLLRADPDDLPLVDVRVTGVDAGAGEDRLPSHPSGPVGDDVLIEEHGGQRVAWLPIGVARAGTPQPLLVVGLSELLAVDGPYLDFLRLTAASLRQALDRVAARAEERGLSEALQRSLLTKPVEPDHLHVAVRYRPAAQQAQVGGDWYDSFLDSNGALVLSVGDIAGHDEESAAAMAQVRNLLRGVSFTTDASPARVLSLLDEAMEGLAVGAFATAVLARVEQDAADAAEGLRTLRWSNAGHPPPVLIDPDGTARLLATPPDVLLGLGGVVRGDHTVKLAPGATVVLYTDGLVERRGVSLTESTAWLVDHLRDTDGLNAEQVCDVVINALGEDLEDDVALLVVHAYPEDRPRPAEAGPIVVPERV